MVDFLSFTLTGLMEGGVYALIALGFVLIYKSTGIFNLAQGEFVLILAYVCWSLLVQTALPMWLGFLLTMVGAGLLGWLVNRICLQPLLGQPILALVAMTLALSMTMRGVTNLIWGGPWQRYPEFISLAGINLGPIILSRQHVVCFAVAMLLLVGFILFFQYSRLGLSMRAVAEGHQIAQGVGISIGAVFGMVWAIGAMISGVGGVLLGSINGINIPLADIGLKALPAALLGGLDSIPGVIVGGLLIGIFEGLAVGYIDPLIGGGTKTVVPFILMIVILVIRPYGLFGLKRIERI